MKKIIAIIFTLTFLNSCADMSIDSNNIKEKFQKFKKSKNLKEFIEE